VAGEDQRSGRGPARDQGERDGDRRISAREAAGRAADYLDEMTGQPPELVIAAEPQDQGWLVKVEVLELARVPDTTDVLACYEVQLDPGGEPTAYRRTHRYHRGQVGEE
jgi:hypothetical protein